LTGNNASKNTRKITLITKIKNNVTKVGCTEEDEHKVNVN